MKKVKVIAAMCVLVLSLSLMAACGTGTTTDTSNTTQTNTTEATVAPTTNGVNDENDTDLDETLNDTTELNETDTVK